MRRDGRGVHGRDDDCRIRDLCGVAAVFAHDADDGCAAFLCELQRFDEIRAHVFFQVASADAEDEERVLLAQPAAAQPLGEDGAPALVVCARGEFGDVVRRRVGLEAADFAEVIHRVRRVARAAADAEDEEPPAAFARGREELHGLFDDVHVQLPEDADGLADVLLGIAHDLFERRVLMSARPECEPTS